MLFKSDAHVKESSKPPIVPAIAISNIGESLLSSDSKHDGNQAIDDDSLEFEV